ncbi:2-phospho-L-lactate guanylyltransferase [Streptomyces sp. NPDC020875]|uniref:2-phospho-L-lactate guanylyltransferase n=1 Tax=Streptomyces sp. NPDC020875 TaxID=3154898 RepID=UPI00341111FD
MVPLKPLALAKSRLSGAVPDAARPGLVLAFAQDTVVAALNCEAVRDVVVVTDDPEAGSRLAALGALIVPDEPGAGLDAALAHGARTVRRSRPGAPVATLNADLPALRSPELFRVLAEAARFPRSFLPDAAGVGTTMLAASEGAELRPAFGGASRRRHRTSGAVELRPGRVDSVRRDVDTAADLEAALHLGVGPFTRARLRMTPTPSFPGADQRE